MTCTLCRVRQRLCIIVQTVVVVDNDDVVVVGSVELDAAIVGAPATGPARSHGLGGDTIDDASCVCLCPFLSGGASSPSLADVRLPGAGVCVVA